MNVLVTGANGFLANNIIRELNKRRVPVKGMVRRTSNLLSLQGANYERVIGNVNHLNELSAASKGSDVIIHAAANTSQQSAIQLDSTDHIGTENVIKVAEKQHLKKVIFVSSANTFGYGSFEKPGTESDEMSPLFKQSIYAMNKLISQQLILQAAKDGRIQATVVNPSFMIGPNDAKPGSGKILLMYLNSKFAMCPPGGKSFVHVNDVAVAICNAIEKGKNGACYLLTGENMTYNSFYKKVEEVTFVSRPVVQISGTFLSLVGKVGSMINRAGGNLELDHVNAQILNIRNYYNSEKATSELDMPQTPLDLAIKEAVKWFAENGYLKNKIRLRNVNT